MKTRDMDRATLIVLELFMGVMAIICGVVLAAGLAEDVLGMHTDLLVDTPFNSFVIPGIILAVVVGGSELLAAFGLWRHKAWGMAASVASGVILMGWIIGEVILLGWIAPHGLQPFCFVYGAIIAGPAARHLLARTPAT